MTPVQRTAAARWGVVAAVVVALVAVPLLAAARPVAAPGNADVRALLQRVLASATVPWSGYVESAGRLALPEVSELGDVSRLLGRTTRLRVWWDGPRHWRVDDVSVASETDAYAVGTGTLTWLAGDRRSVLLVGEPSVRLPEGRDLVPAALARRLLGSLGPRDEVVAVDPRRVAGIDAVGLAVVPRDTTTTVGRVEVWVDPASGLPLEVDVSARGPVGTGAAAASPVLRTRVLDLSVGPVERSLTTFRRDPRTPLEELSTADVADAIDRFAPYRLPDRLAGLPRTARTDDVGGAGGVGTYGEGLTLLAVLPLPPDQAWSILGRLREIDAAPVELAGGEARAVGTPLLSALAVRADDGRGYLLTGAVEARVLQRAATELLSHPPVSRQATP